MKDNNININFSIMAKSIMRLKANTSTDDRRLTKNKIYEGQFICKQNQIWFCCWDNKNEWMTFNVKAFTPIKKAAK